MQRLSSFFGLFFTILLLGLVACETGEDITGKAPVLRLETTTLTVGGDGGRNIVGYSVENGVRGRKPEVRSDVEWITNIMVGDTHIEFMVEKSDVNEERFGRLIVSYEGAASTVSLNVAQGAMSLDLFTITVDELTFNSCSVTYTPADNEMLYMANIIDKEYFNSSGVSTEEAFIDAEIGYYISVAEGYGRTLEELIPAANLGAKGTVTRTFGDMQPGATYVIYCYGLSVSGNDYELTTPIHYKLVTLPMPDMYEVDFDATVAVNTYNMASISMKPLNWSGYYYIQIAPESSLYYVEQGEAPPDYVVKGMGNSFYKQARSYMSKGESAEKFLKTNCYQGARQVNVQLKAGMRYMLIIFAVESEDGSVPVMRSMPELFYFSTN